MSSPLSEESGRLLVTQWRASVVRQLLRFTALVMSLAFLFFLPHLLRGEKYSLAATIAVASCSLLFAAWSDRLSHGVRSFVLAGSVLLVSSAAIISGKTWTPNSFVGMSMVTVVLSVTTGRRAAWWSLGASMVLILGIGAWFVVAGPFAPDDVADVTRAANWARISVLFGPATGLGVLAVSRLVQQLEHTVARQRSEAQLQIVALEEQARRAVLNQEAQRLEALGRLAGGIAHDFNNLLLVVIANAEALPGSEPGLARELTAEIRDAGLRGAELARTLLTFGRGTSGVAPVPLNATVESSLKVLQRLLAADQRFEFVPDPQVTNVESNAGQLGQVVMNLVLNARDAMPRGGTVRVTTCLESDGLVSLSVEDSGTGMDEATRQRVFEPYFTTKPLGRGTGLGLSTAHGIVTSHGGSIQLTSSPGSGTQVRVSLRRSAEAVANAPRPADVPLPAVAAITVLVVDDEPLALRVMARLLKMRGFEVLLAASGAEALALWDTHGDTIKLVITDVLMPGMNGRELHDVLERRAPSVPFLFCSGFSSDVLPSRVLERPGRAMLSKPFTIEALEACLARLLGHI